MFYLFSPIIRQLNFFQSFKKKMIQFQENVCIDRQMGGTTDGQILLYTTLPTTAGDPKKDHNSKTTNEKMNLELEQTKLHKY